MGSRDVQQRLLTTPYVSSWVGRARAGDRYDPDPARRAAAWANWAISSLTELTGVSERSYVAVMLEGRFHDPKGTGPLVRPHLEIPGRLLERSDPELPDRLAQMGNALAFEWWRREEATAAKRALFATRYGSIGPMVDVLNDRRGALADAVHVAAKAAMPQWATVEALLVSEPDGLSGEATGDFSTDEVAEYFPAARDLHVEVVFDSKLREVSRQWASRRLGVWQIVGVDDHGQRFSFGVLTPRLTSNSQFRDPQFAIEKESPASLLVRGLLLRRLLVRHLDGVAASVNEPAAAPKPGRAHLRGVVAQVGQKLPEASLPAAVHFLQAYPDSDAAWLALVAWAERTGTLLTVREEGFKAAHRRALRFLRRAEEPERDDLNVCLPLGWNDGKVVRATFSRPNPDEDS